MRFVPAEALFDTLFTGFASSAFRLETRESYAVPYEDDPLRDFRKGRGVDWGFMDDWVAYIRRVRAAGKTFRRVRVVSEPHSEYARFGLAMARVNTAAGEEIRYLDRVRAEGLPAYDFWVFDQDRVAVLEFDERDDVRGAVVVADPAFVAQHCAWAGQAWQASVPYERYAAAHEVGAR